jgi:hypothetical protein
MKADWFPDSVPLEMELPSRRAYRAVCFLVPSKRSQQGWDVVLVAHAEACGAPACGHALRIHPAVPVSAKSSLAKHVSCCGLAMGSRTEQPITTLHSQVLDSCWMQMEVIGWR